MSATDPLLALEDVNTAYGESHVLFDVSMAIEENEVVALLGRNGAGKTTTLRSIMGIQQPFSGIVTYRGEEITGQETYRIADHGIGYVPEERRVFPNLTVDEHIRMVVDSDYRSFQEEVDRATEIFPPLAELRDREGDNLSGGEQQMLAIARALVGPRELVLLDEPSEGLAPQIVRQVYRAIDRLGDEMTVLLVEQNYPMARAVADRYYILDSGEVVSEGPMEALEANEDLKERYLGVA